MLLKIVFKKIFAVFLSVCLFAVPLSLSAFSADTATVSTDDVVAGESNLLVPIRISSETSVMGFKVSLSFSGEQIKVKKISRGSVTAKGSFVDNLGLEPDKVDVVWHNTSEVDANGTLFVLTLDTSAVTTETEIAVEFSQPDTFNEAYEDVVFNCTNIKILTTSAPVETEITTEVEQEETVTKAESVEVTSTVTAEDVDYDSSQVIDSVNNALDNAGNESIYDVPDDDKAVFVDSVNDNMNIILDTDIEYFDSFEELLDSYTGHYTEIFVNSATDNIEADVLNNLLNESLREFGVDSIDEVTDKKQFVTVIETKLQEQHPDFEKISGYVNEAVVVRAIKELYKENEQDIATDNERADTPKTMPKAPVVILSAIVLIVFVLVVIVVAIKKEKTGKTNPSKDM